MSSPTNSFAAKKLLLAYTRTDGPSTVRNPIVQQLLVRLVSAIPSIFRDRYEATMLESLFTMMYVALLRISEVSYTPKSSHNLRRKQLFLTHHKGQAVVKINMESCKFSKGQVFRMMVSPNMVSPQISPVESYQAYARIRPKADFAFVTKEGSPLSPAYIRASLRRVLDAINHKSLEFNTHSFRIGRATDMYANGYSDIQISKAGRWNSKAFLKYIKPQLINLT